MQSYSRREVIWLLSLSHTEAIEQDASWRDSCSDIRASDDGTAASCGAEDPELPVIARWHDVQRARQNIIRDKEGVAILQLKAAGYMADEEIARLMGRHRLAVYRRWRATVDEILDHLGGEQDNTLEQPRPNPDACLKCGQAPRARLAEVRVRVGSSFKIVEPARQASVCEEHLAPALRRRVYRELRLAA